MYRPTITTEVSVIDEEFFIPKAPVADIMTMRLKFMIRNIAFTNPLHFGPELLGWISSRSSAEAAPAEIVAADVLPPALLRGSDRDDFVLPSLPKI